MESLADTTWDVVISGTGLHQSLLALALSRSGKNILHVDDNEYYGGAEAAFSLQEVDDWAEKHQTSKDAIFSNARVVRSGDGLSFPRAYSIALAPQIIHAKSQLLSQLVSSRAFRQLEFLAVGSFFIFQPSSTQSTDVDRPSPSLSRIPSTREDVFKNTAIPLKAKRSLMKFLRFVLEYDVEPQTDAWKPRAGEPLAVFLASEFKLDEALRAYIITLTLSADGRISVEDGLTSIHRHLTSMGVFGAGFAAVYPKWGGLSEVAQIGCRAAAVGGATYMLGTGIKDGLEPAALDANGDLSVPLANDVTVKSKSLVRGSDGSDTSSRKIHRLTAVVKSTMTPVLEAVVEESPTPAVAIVAFPSGSVSHANGTASDFPIYAMVHSSDTGECPVGQSVIYLSTVSSENSSSLLEAALTSLLESVRGDEEAAEVLYQLSYDQGNNGNALQTQSRVATFPDPSLHLAYDDSMLDTVRQAWNIVVDPNDEEGASYMQFEDREGAHDEDDYDS